MGRPGQVRRLLPGRPQRRHEKTCRPGPGDRRQPPLLFLDEPSAGLDPISSKRLDNLVLDLRERTGAAIVFVSHELPSLFAIADDGIFLDADDKHPIGHGSPTELRDQSQHPTVLAFLHREEPPANAQAEAKSAPAASGASAHQPTTTNPA